VSTHLSSIGPTDITFSDEFKVKWAKWKKDDNDIIPGMYCCGFCGVRFRGPDPKRGRLQNGSRSP
jgi:hypothetical protein